ncbi:EamA family transporter RarD [Oceanobacillus massiliensis]|uniref:EamA family transporter RarD n=1 Tax=Oceanobacillus massiliensis TaxID=1465765 RepID=UPI003017B149
MENKKTNLGIIYTFSAYVLWGFMTIYWKQLDNVPAGEILAYRIVWASAFMILLVIVLGKWLPFWQECQNIIKDRRKLAGITAASIVISLNWFLFIWAVVNGHVLQASLGYYINPLISILLGVVFLKESVTKTQKISFILAAAGVLYLTFSYGVFPWISILLALTFALYGLLKKTVDIGAMFGLTIETLLITPVALIYLWLIPGNSFSFDALFSTTNLYLIGAGTLTAIPLLLFANGAKQIPLAMVGFLQYITPTMMLILGVFFYNETFTHAHLVTFILIWTALFIYMGSVYNKSKTKQKHPSQ